jgi:hypothetical protein
MRTTLAEQASDRRGDNSAGDEQGPARDNPRRRRERQNEREDDDRHGNLTGREQRNGVRHA